MVNVNYEISKDDYEKAQKEGANSLIPLYLFMSYGVYGARVYTENDKYYLTYDRGDSCD